MLKREEIKSENGDVYLVSASASGDVIFERKTDDEPIGTNMVPLDVLEDTVALLSEDKDVRFSVQDIGEQLDQAKRGIGRFVSRIGGKLSGE